MQFSREKCFPTKLPCMDWRKLKSRSGKFHILWNEFISVLSLTKLHRKNKGVPLCSWEQYLRWCRARFSRNTISPFRGILFSILGEKMSTFFPWNFFPGIKCRHFSPGINISPPKLTFSRNNMSERFPWPSHDVWNFWTAEKNDILFRKYWNFFHKIVTFFWFLCQGWFLKTGSKNFNNNFRK